MRDSGGSSQGQTSKKKFSIDGTELGLNLESLFDERGAALQGFLVADESSGESDGLKVRSFHSMFGCTDQMLQPSQGTEFHSAYMIDARSLQPKGITRPSEAVKVSNIPQLREAKRAADEQQAMLRHAAEAIVPEVAAAEAHPNCETERQESEEEAPEAEVVPLLQSQQQGRGKGDRNQKGKGKGKAKGKDKRGKRRTLVPVAKARAGPDEDRRSVAGSVSARSTSTRLSPRGKLLGKAKSWIQTILPETILKGAAEGKSSLGTQTRPTGRCAYTHGGEPDTLTLGAHLELCKIAQDRESQKGKDIFFVHLDIWTNLQRCPISFVAW